MPCFDFRLFLVDILFDRQKDQQADQNQGGDDLDPHKEDGDHVLGRGVLDKAGGDAGGSVKFRREIAAPRQEEVHDAAGKADAEGAGDAVD